MPAGRQAAPRCRATRRPDCRLPIGRGAREITRAPDGEGRREAEVQEGRRAAGRDGSAEWERVRRALEGRHLTRPPSAHNEGCADRLRGGGGKCSATSASQGREEWWMLIVAGSAPPEGAREEKMNIRQNDFGTDYYERIVFSGGNNR